MRDPVELVADGRSDFRVPVPVDICPDRRISVEVFAAAAVPEDRPLAFDQNDRLMLVRAPLFHLGEGMPCVRFVPRHQRFRSCHAIPNTLVGTNRQFGPGPRH